MFSYRCYRVSCLSQTRRLVFPATIDWLAVSAVGEWAVKRLCAGVSVSCQDTDLFKEAIDEAQHRAPEHSSLSGGWEEVHIDSSGVLIARGCWCPHCFGAGGEGLCPCGIYTSLKGLSTQSVKKLNKY